MSIEVHILPECYIDTAVVNKLMAKEGIYVKANHCHGCNKVGNTMLNNLKDDFALGVIDNDKMQHSYNDEFLLIAATEHLELLKHGKKHHYLIKVTPAMDGFILDLARKNGVDMKDYGLPDSLKEFTKLTKSVDVGENKNMKRLFEGLMDDNEMIIFRNLLKYLYEKRFQAVEEELKALMV